MAHLFCVQVTSIQRPVGGIKNGVPWEKLTPPWKKLPPLWKLSSTASVSGGVAE